MFQSSGINGQLFDNRQEHGITSPRATSSITKGRGRDDVIHQTKPRHHSLTNEYMPKVR